jgi:carbonic anhydrase
MSDEETSEDAPAPSRRGFLKSAGIIGGGLALGAGVGKVMVKPAAAAVRPKTAKEISDALLEGNRRFVANASTHPNLGWDVRTKQAEKQTPFAAVLACADSRVAPELVFDQGIGDLFVVRVAGNIASADTVASLAYAVEHLGVTFIMVLGHESCGAVKATIETLAAGPEVPEEFAALINPIAPAVKAAGAEEKDESKLLDAAVAANAKLQSSSLAKASGILKEALEKRKLTIQAATYSVKTSAVTPLTTVS